MDAIYFLKNYKRMCRYYSCKPDCPLYKECSPDLGVKHPETVVNAVRDFADKHPERTRLQDFKEKYPNAEMRTFRDGTKIPMVCARNLGYTEGCSCIGTRFEICIDCWNQPVE